MPRAEPLVTVDWLCACLGDPAVSVLDGSFKMPGVSPLASEDFAEAHIPSAQFFSIDDICDHNSPLPHMLPPPETFAAEVNAMGIGAATHVVVYASNGLLGAARVWWMLRYFGHENVSILNGGLKAWQARGHPITGQDSPPLSRIFSKKEPFKSRINPRLLRQREDVLANILSAREQVLDARASGRFMGEVSEPRPGLRAGHIPGSHNLDHTTLTNPETGCLKTKTELELLFAGADVDPNHPMIMTCGSGISACSLAFALYVTRGRDAGVYDGSWAEWGADATLPLETGPAT